MAWLYSGEISQTFHMAWRPFQNGNTFNRPTIGARATMPKDNRQTVRPAGMESMASTDIVLTLRKRRPNMPAVRGRHAQMICVYGRKGRGIRYRDCVATR